MKVLNTVTEHLQGVHFYRTGERTHISCVETGELYLSLPNERVISILNSGQTQFESSTEGTITTLIYIKED